MADDLTTRHRAVLPSWLALYYAQPIELVRGEGRHVWDADGNRYLDFFGGILTTISGHGVPEVVDAIGEQAGKLLHTSTLYLSRQMVELAERIGALSGIPDAKVFFTPSGSEANDAALLLATCFRQSNQVLALRNSYHGRSFSAIAITGNRSWSPTSLSGLSVAYVHGGYRLRSPYRDLDDGAYTAACVQDLRDVLDMCTSGDVACMIAEPIQGVGGFAVPPDGFFGAMKEVLDHHGILFVSDEVQTGWGRTGDHFWGYQAHDMVPDLLTFAKGVGNGLALGGVVARAEIMDCITANSISTFGGNPLATAGALANLEFLLSHDLQGNALKMGHLFVERLRPLTDRIRLHRRDPRPGADAGDRNLPAGRHHPVARSRRCPHGVVPPAGATHRKRWTVRQRAANRAAAVAHRSRSRRRSRHHRSGNRRGRRSRLKEGS